ncbi:MAG TPA: VOC family protein [Bacteroidota bacterium]|nr:VOC family protein [Bacteroidota bacterium]
MTTFHASRPRVKRIVLFAALVVCNGLLYSQSSGQPRSPEPGLLFYLSGEHGFAADYSAGGTPNPNFLEHVARIPDGAKGAGFACEDKQLMSYWAPGNIYAERGTLSFFWRARTPVGKTEFPVFRVGYSDHSSWDMVWLRIDYNGHGFDAFVTDINLARIRVSYTLSPFPNPTEWIHLALAWDETIGIRFYVNGKLAAQKDSAAVLYAGLDQFGPHSRIISPMQVQSAYNFQRGGDIDEIRIYDRMLSPGNIQRLAQGEPAGSVPAIERDPKTARWQSEWRLRYGWNRSGDSPPYLENAVTSVRNVAIQNAYDLKRWWWKANDGIRETTWPGVYNRSRLPGRHDYFELPDWDCYAVSGNAISFFLPDEPWNHLEISGGAWGELTYAAKDTSHRGVRLFSRPRGQEKTFHRLQQTRTGGTVRFANAEQETPIGELWAYNVTAGAEPHSGRVLQYYLHAGSEGVEHQAGEVLKYITGRFTADERSMMTALPWKAEPTNAKRTGHSLPVVHILVLPHPRAIAPAGAAVDSAYSWETIGGGLDGIAIDLPPMHLQTIDGALIPMNIQVRDPIWPNRMMFDFSFSIKPGEGRTLWLDLRDRILPPSSPLYLIIASGADDFSSASLEGSRVRLIFKDPKDAVREHIQDRFSQAKDNYAFFVEERPEDARYNLFNRFQRDILDLLKVDPKHYPAQNYWYDLDHSHTKPVYVQPAVPAGVPAWAFRQVEDLRYFKRFVLWWIDNRQISDGELGGGLSDDDDLTNCWPGAALMGCAPEKINAAILRLLDAIYANGMITNGLSTIQTDGLHTHEEGIEAQAQAMLVDYGSPKQVERIMETVRALDEKLILKNKAGHRHFRSSYVGANKIADEGVWEWSLQQQEFLLLQPVLTLVEFNGNQRARQLAIDVADGLLAHATKDKDGKIVLHSEINFSSDSARPSPLGTKAMLTSSMGDGATISTSSAALQLFWGVYRLTGDRKYLQPLLDLGEEVLGLLSQDALDVLDLRGTWGASIAAKTTPGKGPDLYRHIAWQMTGNKTYLERYYADEAESSALREYINTEGSLWSDRVFAANRELQRSRLGGVALVRGAIHSGHAVSWQFKAPASDQSVAIIVPEATPTSLKIIAYTLDQKPVEASMTLWNIDPGMWEITQGLDRDDDEKADTTTMKQVLPLERTRIVRLTLEPRATTVLTLRLQSKGVPYSSRPDLGIDKGDVSVEGGVLRVKVHGLGSAASSQTLAAIMHGGTIAASAPVPAMEAPVDLKPKTQVVVIPIPPALSLDQCDVMIDPDNSLNEITMNNNRVALRDVLHPAQRSPEHDEVSKLPKKPRFEHVAFNVADPAAVAKWYCDNLGMKILRKSPPPATTHFVADSAESMTLELYRNEKGAFPDFNALNVNSMHLAFTVDDLAGIKERLLAAGARIAEDVITTPSGDSILMLRDPWGLPLQLSVRKIPMLRTGGIRLEHIALNTNDPRSAANWYCENLGLAVVREGAGLSLTRFVADEGKNMMLEFSTNAQAAIPDLAKLNTVSFHVAFVVDDVRAMRTGLIEAGATLAEELRETNSGDQVLVLRDPWGMPIQFIQRVEPLLK